MAINKTPRLDTQYSEIDLRRKVIIQRAIVPQNYTPNGTEFEIAFEGYIDEWRVDEDIISIRASDNHAVLKDAAVLDNYSYDSRVRDEDAELILEDYLQEKVIDKYSPVMITEVTASTVTTNPIGYKGLTPVVYSPSGYTLDPTRKFDSSWVIRHNEEQSSSVWEICRDTVDSSGLDLRYRYYPPDKAHRLEVYNPPRDMNMPVERIESWTATAKVLMQTPEPHNLQVGQLVTITGATPTTAWNATNCEVLEIVSHYEVVLDHPVSGTTTTAADYNSATNPMMFSYTPTWRLPQPQVRGFSGIGAKIEDIRNHIEIRYNRQVVKRELKIWSMWRESGKPIAALLYRDWDVTASTIRPVDFVRTIEVDPNQQGIEVTITGLGSPIDGVNGDHVLIANPIEFGVGESTIIWVLEGTTGASFGPYTATTGQADTGIGKVISDSIRFDTVIASDIVSIQKYGYRPAAIHEGASTHLETAEEARRLAQRVLADLMDPSEDFEVETQTIPFRVHDMVRLEQATRKGLWNALDCAVVATKESFSSGKASLSLTLRKNRPTRSGSRWNPILVGADSTRRRVSAPDGLWKRLTDDAVAPEPTIINQDIIDNRLPAKLDINFPLKQSRILESERDIWSLDSVEVHASTESNYTPGPDTFKFRTTDGMGQISNLTPGQTYYTKLRLVDREGNISRSISLPSSYVRATERKPEVTLAFLGARPFIARPFDGESSLLNTTLPVTSTLTPAWTATIAAQTSKVITNDFDDLWLPHEPFLPGPPLLPTYQYIQGAFQVPVTGTYSIKGRLFYGYGSTKPSGTGASFVARIMLRSALSYKIVGELFNHQDVVDTSEEVELDVNHTVYAQQGDHIFLWLQLNCDDADINHPYFLMPAPVAATKLNSYDAQVSYLTIALDREGVSSDTLSFTERAEMVLPSTATSPRFTPPPIANFAAVTSWDADGLGDGFQLLPGPGVSSSDIVNFTHIDRPWTATTSPIALPDNLTIARPGVGFINEAFMVSSSTVASVNPAAVLGEGTTGYSVVITFRMPPHAAGDYYTQNDATSAITTTDPWLAGGGSRTLLFFGDNATGTPLFELSVDPSAATHHFSLSCSREIADTPTVVGFGGLHFDDPLYYPYTHTIVVTVTTAGTGDIAVYWDQPFDPAEGLTDTVGVPAGGDLTIVGASADGLGGFEEHADDWILHELYVKPSVLTAAEIKAVYERAEAVWGSRRYLPPMPDDPDAFFFVGP
jgi:hypothetical protein